MMNVKFVHVILAILVVLGIFVITFQLGQSSGELNKRHYSFQDTKEKEKRRDIKVISWDPRIFYASNILTPEECDHIIKIGEKDLTRSEVVSPSGHGEVSDARSSYGAFLSRHMEDPVIKKLAREISSWTFTPIENAEVFYLLRYEIGQEYKPHTDWFERKEENKHIFERGGQRVATVITYLSEAEGGETVFPNLGIEIKPSKGDALLFWNVNTNGTEDYRTLHGSNPVKSGTKWALTRWIREFEMK